MRVMSSGCQPERGICAVGIHCARNLRHFIWMRRVLKRRGEKCRAHRKWAELLAHAQLLLGTFSALGNFLARFDWNSREVGLCFARPRKSRGERLHFTWL